MEKFTLTPKEFLFLCAGLGVTEIYGVEDGYKDVDLSDISSEIIKVQKSLEDKKYIESDFDGNSSVRYDLIGCVGTCALCKKLVAIDCQLKSGEVTNIVYYISDKKTIISEKKNGMYHLSEANGIDIGEAVKSIIKLEDIKEPLQFNKIHIPQKELDKIKKMVLKDDKKTAIIAMKKYFDDKITEIIIRGFENKENFYSVATIDFTAEIDNIKTVMFINADMANIKFQPVVIDLVTEVEFEAIDTKEIYNIIDEYLSEIISDQEVGDNNG